MPFERKSLRLLATLGEALRINSRGNTSAFIRATVDAFIASGALIESTRALGARLESKTEPLITRITVDSAMWSHWERYARSNGGHTVAALVQSALAALWHGPRTVTAPAAAPDVATVGWKSVLMKLVPGQTIEFCRNDLPTTLRRARHAALDAAEGARDVVAGLRITTQLTRRTLWVTRVA